MNDLLLLVYFLPRKVKNYFTVLGCFASDRVPVVDGILLAQNENGSIGLVNEKCVDLPKKAG